MVWSLSREWFILVLPIGLLGGIPLLWYLTPLSLKRRLLLSTILDDTSPPTEAQQSKTYRGSVLPHSALQMVSDNLWVVIGTLPQPGPKFSRNMVVYRIPNSRRLVLHSVLCVNEHVLRQISHLGDVEYIIVPNSYHRLDASLFQSIYPDATLICPRRAMEKVNQWVKVTTSVEDVLRQGDLCIEALCPEGVSFLNELLYLCKLENGETALICTDLFFNVNPSTADFVSRFMGVAGGFGFTHFGKLLLDDIPTVKRWITKNLLEIVGYKISVLVVAHGDIITGCERVESKLVEAINRL